MAQVDRRVMEKAKQDLHIYKSDGKCWNTFASEIVQKRRKIESVILEESLKESMIEDLTDFMKSSDW